MENPFKEIQVLLKNVCTNMKEIHMNFTNEIDAQRNTWKILNSLDKVLEFDWNILSKYELRRFYDKLRIVVKNLQRIEKKKTLGRYEIKEIKRRLELIQKISGEMKDRVELEKFNKIFREVVEERERIQKKYISLCQLFRSANEIIFSINLFNNKFKKDYLIGILNFKLDKILEFDFSVIDVFDLAELGFKCWALACNLELLRNERKLEVNDFNKLFRKLNDIQDSIETTIDPNSTLTYKHLKENRIREENENLEAG